MKYNDNGTYKDIYVKTFDTLPVGAEVDYDGSVVPDGWTEVLDVQPSVYSADETICGTWLGKPLYRKVYDIGNLPNASLKHVQAGVTGITCRHLYGTAVGTGTGSSYAGYTLTLPFVHTNSASNGISLRYDGSGGNSNIDIVTGTDQSGYVGYVVMEYTKNSD